MIRVHEEYEITDKDLNKKCDQCDEVFNDPQEFNDHLRLWLKDPKDFSCKFCETKWVSHQSCHICGHATDHSNVLGCIKKHVHEKKYDHICHLCGKGFKGTNKLQLHLDSKHGQGERKHKCETCGKKYWTAFGLKNHIEATHSSSVYECDQCPKTFKLTGNLQQHVRIVHENYRPFKCDLCEEKFLYERDLKRHQNHHH